MQGLFLCLEILSSTTGVFILIALPLMFFANLLSANTPGLGSLLGWLVIIGAYILTTAVKRALIDPIVTIAMIRSYQNSIKDLEPSLDLQQKLLGVSSKFKNLFNKSKEKEATEVVS